MAEHSSIEWTDATWNPVRGCTKISPWLQALLCRTIRRTLSGRGRAFIRAGVRPPTRARQDRGALALEGPRRIFVNSMADLFRDQVPLDYIKRIFAAMNQADWHQY